jgi:hypothetical protein
MKALLEAMSRALDAITSRDAEGFFKHCECGYRFSVVILAVVWCEVRRTYLARDPVSGVRTQKGYTSTSSISGSRPSVMLKLSLEWLSDGAALKPLLSDEGGRYLAPAER